MYHYAGNNPIRYIDPDGKRSLSYYEKSYISEVLGNVGNYAVSNAFVINLPNGRSASTHLFYVGQIWLSNDIYSNPLSTLKGRNILVHECFHQIQYLFEPGGLTVVNGPSAFENLLYEQGLYSIGNIDVYSYGDYRSTDLSKYNSLSDMPYYESQAQMVGDFAELYYLGKKGYSLSEKQRDALKYSSRILSNSGFDSEAIKWVKENIN